MPEFLIYVIYEMRHVWYFEPLRVFFFKDLFIYLFLDRGKGREGEREGEKHLCVMAPGDLAHNPGMCPDWESNRRPFDLQAGTQSTESHQPGLEPLSFEIIRYTAWVMNTVSLL